MHRNPKKQLEFESLEAMELLSGAGIVASHAGMPQHPAMIHRAAKGPVGDVALNLSGTVHGTYRVIHGGTEASFSGRGGITPIGKARMQGAIAYSSADGGGQLTLNFGKSGKITAAITGQASPSVYIYQVTGGTRTFAGDSGTGVAVVDILSANAVGTRGRFALSLRGASTG